MIPAPQPSTTRVAAANVCESATVELEHGGEKTVTVPPRPGLQAAIIGTRIAIDVDPGSPPAACKPARIGVMIENTRGNHEITIHVIRTDQPGRHHLVLTVPSYFSASPDVARAYAVMEHGIRSAVASVNVQR